MKDIYVQDTTIVHSMLRISVECSSIQKCLSYLVGPNYLPIPAPSCMSLIRYMTRWYN